jgi:hypothetical protein
MQAVRHPLPEEAVQRRVERHAPQVEQTGLGLDQDEQKYVAQARVPKIDLVEGAQLTVHAGAAHEVAGAGAAGRGAVLR